MFNTIYLQIEEYDGTESSEELITFAPVRVNESDVEYMKTAHVFEFIEWMHDNTDDTRMVTSKKAYKKWWCTPLRGWFTVEQLYEYWLTVK